MLRLYTYLQRNYISYNNSKKKREETEVFFAFSFEYSSKIYS